MKFSKASLMVLVGGIFLVAFVSLGAAYLQKNSQRAKASAELSSTEQRLSNMKLKMLYGQKQDLQVQLKQIGSQITEATANLTQPIDSIDITDALFKIAKSASVNITSITSTGIGSDDLSGVPANLNQPAIAAEGEMSKLIDFITRLNNDFTTGVVTSYDISLSDNATPQISKASIRLAIYTHQGE